MIPPQGAAALLEEALVVYKGSTTSDGNVGGTTLICLALAAKADWDGNQIILTSGTYEGQARDINGVTNNVTGTITVANAFGGKIVSGTSFIITGIRTVPAEIAALQADVGDFSAQSNLKSLLAVLGSGWNTANKTLYAALITDRLDDATIGLAALEALLDSAEVAGPYSYTDAGGEQTVKEDTAVTRRHVSVEVSNRNMTQTGTFKIYRKVDGTNYDLYISQAVKVVAGSDRAWDAEFTTNQAWKITYEEDSNEGAARDVPYNVITQEIE